jgi:hypothetical protein
MIKETSSNNSTVRLSGVLAILTARFTKSALILVTAATEEDDTRLLATSIAQVVQAAGKRAAYVSLVSAPLYFEDETGGPHTILRPSVAALCSPAAFDNAATMWREQHDFLFVDAPNLLATNLVPHIARKADGVLIAMRRGRPVSAKDRDAAAILKNLGAFTLGVVTTSSCLSRPNGSSARNGHRTLLKSWKTTRDTQRIEN